MKRQRRTIGKLAAAGLGALVLAGAVVAYAGGGTTSSTFSKAGNALDDVGVAARGAAGTGTARESAPAAPGAGDRAGGEVVGAKASPDSTDLGGTPLPGVTSKVVKTGTLELEVKKGNLDDAYTDAIVIANEAGGYLAGTDRSTHRAVLTIKVPADKFEAVLAKLGKSGKVTGTQVQSEDVTAEYVDLDARLRNWKAQEAVFLDLMAEAKTIGDTITVQQQLSAVQQQIEQIEGQQRLLEGQAAMSTLTLTVAEPGVVVRPTEPEAPSTLATAWHRAWNASAAIVGGVIVVLGVMIPLGIIALVGFLLFRLFTRTRRPRTPAVS